MTIIKPQYSSKDIEKLYFGPNPRKTYDIKISMGLQNQLLKAAWCIFFFLLITRGLRLSLPNLILEFPLYTIPVVLLKIYIFMKRKVFREIGEPYQPPITYGEYIRLTHLYREAEKIIPCLENRNIKSMVIKEDNSVHIQIQGQLVQKEYRCVFESCTEEIFWSGSPNTIDFSVIDKTINNIKKQAEFDKARNYRNQEYK